MLRSVRMVVSYRRPGTQYQMQ